MLEGCGDALFVTLGICYVMLGVGWVCGCGRGATAFLRRLAPCILFSRHQHSHILQNHRLAASHIGEEVPDLEPPLPAPPLPATSLPTVSLLGLPLGAHLKEVTPFLRPVATPPEPGAGSVLRLV